MTGLIKEALKKTILVKEPDLLSLNSKCKVSQNRSCKSQIWRSLKQQIKSNNLLISLSILSLPQFSACRS